MAGQPTHLVTTMEALEALYEQPSVPLDHQGDRPHQRALPRADRGGAVLRAGDLAGRTGMDCSPRGDAPGFVRVQDEKTLLIPDRRGNNRIDSLRNLIHDPRVALLFLIPGCGETIRVNGRAAISTDPALCESFVVERQGAARRPRRHGRPRLLPVPQGDRALEAVGPDACTSTARACRPPARSSRRAHGREARRRRARPQLAAADQGDDLLSARHGSRVARRLVARPVPPAAVRAARACAPAPAR